MINFKTIFIISAVATTGIIGATSPTTTSQRAKVSKSERITLREHAAKTHNRPKAPSRQRIGCEYDGQVLALDFVYPEGECNVTLTEYYSGAQQSYVVDSSDCYAEIPVGQIYESTVTLTTPSGTTYTCELTAD